MDFSSIGSDDISYSDALVEMHSRWFKVTVAVIWFVKQHFRIFISNTWKGRRPRGAFQMSWARLLSPGSSRLKSQ